MDDQKLTPGQVPGNQPAVNNDPQTAINQALKTPSTPTPPINKPNPPTSSTVTESAEPPVPPPPPPIIPEEPDIKKPGRVEVSDKTKKNIKIGGAILGIFLLLGGLVGSRYLVQQQKAGDIRKEAVECSGCSCDECPDECNEAMIPNPEACGEGNFAYCCSPKEDDGGDPCTTCVGRCDRSGCSVSGSGTDCRTNCGYWPGCSYCRGLSTSACGELHSSYYYGTGGTISYAEEYWCSTIQCDSNAPNGACIVVYIGDNGEWCIDGASNVCSANTGNCSFNEDRNNDGQVNQKDLDWNCDDKPVLTPTPSPTAEFVCLDPMTINPNPPIAGQAATLTCRGAVLNNTIDRFDFQYRETGGNWTDLGNSTDTDNNNQESLVINTVPSGAWEARCRVCITTGECSQWYEP
ncbi:hypothetical protein KKD62_01855 [Patescibacteria group bacterium]|nr:hypothetical protein [Patescibacteria group bacterium]MBU1931096.1 hypothetical protein [Patescibacteria group bacterium]